VSGQLQSPAVLPLGKNPLVLIIQEAGWVPCLDDGAVKNLLTLPGIEPDRPACSYTDCAIQGHVPILKGTRKQEVQKRLLALFCALLGEEQFLEGFPDYPPPKLWCFKCSALRDARTLHCTRTKLHVQGHWNFRERWCAKSGIQIISKRDFTLTCCNISICKRTNEVFQSHIYNTSVVAFYYFNK
jgi:hypothetical protein